MQEVNTIGRRFQEAHQWFNRNQADSCRDDHCEQAAQNTLTQLLKMIDEGHLNVIGEVGILRPPTDANRWWGLQNWTVWAVGHAC